MWMWACGLLLVVAVVFAWMGLKDAGWGDVDPASLMVSALSLAVSIWSGWQTVRATQITDTDVDLWAQKLEAAIVTAETAQRGQLLGRQDRTIDVAFILTPAPGHNASHAASEATMTNVAGYFRKLRPQRLVITGDAGSGKTVLAVELILGLLTDDDRRPDDPIPVRLPAAAWDAQTSVEDWLAAHLVRTFNLSKVTARALLRADRVLPVIDGLDEMDAEPEPGYGSRAGGALRALNAYQRGRGKARLVLTCRATVYDALIADDTWAQDAARVTLSGVTADQAWTFIEAVAGAHQRTRWQPVLDALTQPGHPLAEALATPWRLTLAVTVYQQRSDTGAYLRDPAELAHLAGQAGTTTGPDQIRDHLLSLFIPATIVATTPPGAQTRYRPGHVHKWLAVLARYLDTNMLRPPLDGRTLSSTDLVLHELWPLAGNRSRVLGLGVIAFITAVTAVMVPMLALAIGPDGITISAIAAIGLGGGGSLIAWLEVWPRLTHIDLTQMKSPTAIIAGYVVCPMFGLWGGATNGNGVAGLTAGLLIGLLLSLAGSLMIPGHKPVPTPRDIVRDSLASGSAFLLLLGLSVGLVAGIGSELSPGGLDGIEAAATASPTALAFGLYVVAIGGPGNAGLRYLLLMLCMTRRLPWKLARFLHWCYTDTGLIRIAGIAYQFRHRELQEYLIRHPQP